MIAEQLPDTKNDEAEHDDGLTRQERSRLRQLLHDSAPLVGEMVLELVRQYPGRTCDELFAMLFDAEREELKELQEVRRRMSDLWQAGHVRRGASRRCSVKGSLMYTWNVT